MGRYSRRQKERGMKKAAQPWVLAPDAFRRLIEERVQARFDMSLAEFAEAFRAGKLEDDPAAYELAVASGASSRRD